MRTREVPVIETGCLIKSLPSDQLRELTAILDTHADCSEEELDLVLHEKLNFLISERGVKTIIQNHKVLLRDVDVYEDFEGYGLEETETDDVDFTTNCLFIGDCAWYISDGMPGLRKRKRVATTSSWTLR